MGLIVVLQFENQLPKLLPCSCLSTLSPPVPLVVILSSWNVLSMLHYLVNSFLKSELRCLCSVASRDTLKPCGID